MQARNFTGCKFGSAWLTGFGLNLALRCKPHRYALNNFNFYCFFFITQHTSKAIIRHPVYFNIQVLSLPNATSNSGKKERVAALQKRQAKKFSLGGCFFFFCDIGPQRNAWWFVDLGDLRSYALIRAQNRNSCLGFGNLLNNNRWDNSCFLFRTCEVNICFAGKALCSYMFSDDWITQDKLPQCFTNSQV